MTDPIVAIDNISYRYPDGREALTGISLSIQPGERVALLGPNGSGKSTLLLHLNGVLPLQTGAITIDSVPLNDKTLGDIRARLGMTFQEPDDQLFSTTVYEDVAFGPLHMGLPPNAVKTRVQTALDAVGMAEYARRSSTHLSTGEKKRIALATILSMEPHIFALDEPSAGLDPRGRRQLVALLDSFTDKTMLISTHDMRLAAALCTRAVVLDAGQVVADGPAAQLLYDRDLMERHGLETP